MRGVERLKLLQEWNGFGKGVVLTAVPTGQANLMIQNGFAEYDYTTAPVSGSDEPDNGTATAKRSKKASGNRTKR